MSFKSSFSQEEEHMALKPGVASAARGDAGAQGQAGSPVWVGEAGGDYRSSPPRGAGVCGRAAGQSVLSPSQESMSHSGRLCSAQGDLAQHFLGESLGFRVELCCHQTKTDLVPW